MHPGGARARSPSCSAGVGVGAPLPRCNRTAIPGPTPHLLSHTTARLRPPPPPPYSLIKPRGPARGERPPATTAAATRSRDVQGTNIRVDGRRLNTHRHDRSRTRRSRRGCPRQTGKTPAQARAECRTTVGNRVSHGYGRPTATWQWATDCHTAMGDRVSRRKKAPKQHSSRRHYLRNRVGRGGRSLTGTGTAVGHLLSTGHPLRQANGDRRLATMAAAATAAEAPTASNATGPQRTV